MKVLKFGGTSVASPERIARVAQIIAARRQAGESLVVVVSAMGRTTDDLIGLAHEVSRAPAPREMDMLLTVGERVSMALLSMALSDLGVDACSLTGSQSGIITTGHHRRAKIVEVRPARIRDHLARGQVVIVAGFQGVSEDREITTLGRGGSDTTAVALAASLGAEGCEIYTDVTGIYSGDPRVVGSTAKRLSAVPSDWMVEMAHRGAGVLHPRCVELAMAHGVKLRVLSSFLATGPENGTDVVLIPKKESPPMESFRVLGVACDEDWVGLEVELARAGAAGSIWSAADQAGLSVLSPVFLGERIAAFVARDALADWRKCLERLTHEGFIRRFDIHEDRIPLSLVGERLSDTGRVLSELAEVLGASEIPVWAGSASALALTVGIRQNRAEEAVQKVHQHFVEKPEGARP